MVKDPKSALQYSFFAPVNTFKEGNNGSVVDPTVPVEEEINEENATSVVHVVYTWKAYNWSRCSALCDSGQESREVECVSESDQAVDDELCDPAKKPATSQTCSMELCANYQWITGSWSEVCLSTYTRDESSAMTQVCGCW